MKQTLGVGIKRIGLFDSGIGGFSILSYLLDVVSDAEYFYFSDDANAPYGPKSDDFITERSIEITKILLAKKVDLIVVACNTATAASIDLLRSEFPDKVFVGVEPYLNSYYKMPDGEKNMVVLTTVSTGKSERFKRLKERLDPAGKIHHIALLNLARLIEDFYFKRIDQKNFLNEIENELKPHSDKNYTHAILGCTHYPLISTIIENQLKVKAISSEHYVALRICELLNLKIKEKVLESNNKFTFCSSKNNQWVEMNQSDCVLPFTV